MKTEKQIMAMYERKKKQLDNCSPDYTQVKILQTWLNALDWVLRKD